MRGDGVVGCLVTARHEGDGKADEKVAELRHQQACSMTHGRGPLQTSNAGGLSGVAAGLRR